MNLKQGYCIFGGKGDVWSDSAHISKSSDSTTLCGKPMLSTNWCRIEKIETPKCEECLDIYKSENNETLPKS